ncbi:hypothetical protein SAMN02745664_102100 [Moraxella cuniculi DSM 21768]|uniref:Surface-adhesin protein E-like domain-containing protein n=1 Tax=Moraxella cuniculi DSM 21768 TaxID=1122245 RepID=A0A1N7DTT6_9GAMM|nr:surface-adhesin E family protein [Moraxella cuniculi]SIR79105.1 hypothetical protein SAMN02745664_102100 [Moraxella cuniculi DSM 21768]
MLFIFISPTAHAVNWLEIGKATDKSLTASIDLDSIRSHQFSGYNSRSYLSVWVKYDFTTAQKANNGKLYRQTKDLIYIDCDNKKWTIKEVHKYTSTGNVVDNLKNPYLTTSSSNSWESIIPETSSERIVELTCYYAQNK